MQRHHVGQGRHLPLRHLKPEVHKTLNFPNAAGRGFGVGGLLVWRLGFKALGRLGNKVP